MRQLILASAIVAGAAFGSLSNLHGQQAVPVQPRQAGVDSSDAIGATDFYKASDLIGMQVQGADGQVIGEVRDLLIDARSEQVRYMLLDSGATAQAGGEFLVLPSAIAQVNYFVDQPNQRFIRIDFDRQKLAKAPRIPTVDIRGLRNPKWVVEVDKYFNVRERRSARPDFDRPVRERREGVLKQRDEQRSGDDQPQTNPPDTNAQQPLPPATNNESN